MSSAQANVSDYVLLSWTARNNDPFERDRQDQFPEEESKRIWGPSLTLLFHERSPYRGRVKDAIFYYRKPVAPSKDDPARETELAEQTRAEVRREARRLSLKLSVELRAWESPDPTDHKAIFVFMEKQLLEIRRCFPERPLLIHLSPGTPSMQTIWMVLVETGYVKGPVTLVKSYKEKDAQTRPLVERVELGIPSLYKRLQESRPTQLSEREQGIFWDPAHFKSERLKKLYEEAQRLARLRVPVLILGERGTGKTHFASWIRLNSPFRKPELDAHWPSVPCGQYTPELMRAELFGYEKGAFTGATQRYEGLLTRADGDTLFLDEVGDVSRDLQRLLIRAIEDRTFTPVGSSKVQRSTFRLITATNLSPDQLRLKLDPDFFDRIGYFVLTMPPLRELREELEWLWDAVFRITLKDVTAPLRAERLGREHHTRIVKRLQAHTLPGNLRDLFRVAWHLLAGLEAPEELRPSPEEAVTHALERALCAPVSEQAVRARAVCQAFADQKPLESVLPPDSMLDVDMLERELHGYLAQELRRVAKQRKVSLDRVCNRSERALQEWAKGSKTPTQKKLAGHEPGEED